MAKLPIGVQTFSKIRNDDYYYVDKTAYVSKLIEQGSYYFLSRPRRFGKSLLVDTLQELFEGNEPLFRDLYIHDKWDWTIQYPVIKISFGQGVLKNRAELDQTIRNILIDQQKKLNVERLDGIDVDTTNMNAPNVSHGFATLIRRVHEKYGQRVVVLVDEYDKPILDNITDSAIALEMREGLKNLYSVIKDSDAHIRFAFLTGVSKFSKVSLFSGLNNLNDITLDRNYAPICGYTDNDVDTVFTPELKGLDRSEIKRWYNGYNWLGDGVYNPFDLLLLFEKSVFRPYWFETGTPTFLIQMLLTRQQFLPELTKLESDLELLSSFDIEHISLEALMFQTGYLTIAKEENLSGNWFYELRYPNQEVFQSLNNSLLQAYTADSQATIKIKRALIGLLTANDFDAIEKLIQSFFDSIPGDWYRKNPIAQYEGYYASVFFAYFAALGLDIVVEETTNQGRVDMTVRYNGHIYLFEFKVVELVPEGKAIEQLKQKDYAAKYRASGKPIHLIGIEFSRDQRNIVAFDVESI